MFGVQFLFYHTLVDFMYTHILEEGNNLESNGRIINQSVGH
jgi:hypothetical protein